MDAIEILTWGGIALCVSQSGIFSGLNLAMFGLSALQLRIKADAGDERAAKLMEIRRDSNFLLTTILWGNVSTNVLLTLLSDSVMAGVAGFVFSTFAITFFGEIIPQAYFSRNALRMASLMRPVLRFWQIALYPIAKPSALALDAWLGPEGLEYIGELEMRHTLRRFVAAPESDLNRVEGIGALNFLAIDDLPVSQEGEPVHAASVIELPARGGDVEFPQFDESATDPFLRSVQASGKRWVVLTDPGGAPHYALDADGFLRSALLDEGATDVRAYCHRPIVVTDPDTTFETVLPQLNVVCETEEDDVIDHDLVLVWGDERRLITGADILGRLLRGIPKVTHPPGAQRSVHARPATTREPWGPQSAHGVARGPPA